ncbi:EamA family transporter RarD [Halalkalibacterium halodurans]|uniref:Transporter n=1 Tax=Halalkalibacterium halodurans TaxID=86665 RepID=A0A0M0KG72_ALKHA|nr:EamA family transporter RarD [Halalkalibacterium halodurans]MED3645860.1 EamA family transporter RarD [Halalkalibacterium halodurans]MED4079574.1 EamA family transporter RarD [Halalkalibacterium halodurans]MED4084149.1 EamA family transporter RarD [Halalkalibacterium halodurans]MED4104627.1 EamA family transporter RarD [Halalkalibacterium halodurans]MED4108355.1 EamA family transporter RarD [Halalkalibacterium halodurans]
MKNQQKTGVIAAISAYLIWGFLPLYWKLVDEVPASEMLAHRIVWSLGFMVILLAVMKKNRQVMREILDTLANKKTAFGITMAAILISMNWFIFIYAVSSDKVIEASLGYYINPLINVLLAIVFLRESLSKWEVASFLLAAAGVLNITLHYGSFPWVAFALAISFGVYGLIKKVVSLSAWASLTIETLIMTPFALLFLLYIPLSGGASAFSLNHLSTAWLIIASGAATALPLLLFATGAKRISFSLIGFLQYLAPTIMLMLGVFLFQEPFSRVQFVSFLLIWTGLIIFTISRSRTAGRLKKEALAKASA